MLNWAAVRVSAPTGSERQLPPFARVELDYLATQPDPDSSLAPVLDLHRELTWGHGQIYPPPTVANVERQVPHLCGKEWIEPEHIVAGLNTQIAALQKVHRAGHGAQMNSFGGSAALGVVQVAIQGIFEEFPRTLTIGAGHDPGVHHSAEGGSVRGPLQVVVDGSRDGVGYEGIAEPFEDRSQLGGREQVEQHEHIGLLGGLVGIGRVVLALQDAIEAGDVAIACPVDLPVQLGQVLVALKLTDDAVTLDHETHLAADVLPMGELGVVQRQAFAQLATPGCRQEIDQFERSTQDPDSHDVGVGIVVQTRGCGSDIAVVVLVRACLLYTSPSPRDRQKSRMPSS